jgi:type II secretory pathway pseudopilin PulG
MNAPRRCSCTLPTRIGFTIFELLIVIAVIGILIALLLPAVSTTRESARRSMCSANQKQLALAVLTFQETRRKFPTSAFFGKLSPLQDKLSAVVPGSSKDDKTKAPYSFLVTLLPYVEEGFLYEEIDFEKNPFDEANLDIANSVVPLFMCPSHDGFAHSNAVEYEGEEKPALTQYKALGATTFAVLDDPEAVKDTKGDGGVLQPYVAVRSVANVSRTIMLSETKEPTYSAWYDGTTVSIPGFHPEIDKTKKATTVAINYRTPEHPVFLTKKRFGGAADMQWGASSNHRGLAVHVFCDTSTRTIDNDIDADVYKAMITRRSDDNRPQ